MMDNNVIQKCIDFAYECLINTDVVHPEIKDYAKTYRFEHSLRVMQNAKMLAEVEIEKGSNVNLLTCMISSILHDIGKFKCFIIDEEHGILGSKMARPFLEGLGLEKKQIDDICYCISAHSGNFKVYEYEDILEAHIVQEADDIDRYGMYRVYCQISDYEAEESSFEGKANRAKRYIEKLNRELEKVIAVTDLGKKIITEEIKLQILALTGYYEQMAKTKGIE